MPVHSDRKLFEFLILEGAQAGLSWTTILNKRAHYRKVFDRFDPTKVARYRTPKIRQLLNDPGIVRNRLKIESAIRNAKAFLTVRDGTGLCQCVVEKNEQTDGFFDTVKRLPQESSLRVTGTVRTDARAEGGHELAVIPAAIVWPWRCSRCSMARSWRSSSSARCRPA